MKRILLLTFIFSVFVSVHAQQGRVWTALPADKTPVSARLEKRAIPNEFQIFSLDFALLKSQLASAPLRTESHSRQGVVVSFPNQEGQLEKYQVYEAPVMAPELAAKYPDIKSYVGKGIDDPTATIRFSTTIFGLHTMTFSGLHNNVFIEPYSKDLNKYMVYSRDKLASPGDFFCATNETAHESQNRNANSTQSNNQIYRTYRLALSCTIEYAAYHVSAAGLSGGTLAQKKAAVLAAMVVTMTRVNGVYERDLAVHLNLIANNDSLINITSDNFSNNNGFSLLGENQSFVDSAVGSANYDIGHVFSTGGGGVAGLGVVCNNSQKARGVTGSPAPVGDAYDIDYVAHEMGHQFGGEHTFNSDQGSCSGNKSINSAIEPGSGSTIMAYAGICGSQNVQNNSDAHFSVRSLEQIDNFINGSGGNCANGTSIANSPPVIGSLPNYVIPKSTPFILKGSATDADGDPITYCWEQYDHWATNSSALSANPVATNTGGPNFRSRPPSTSPERYFPILSAVISNNLAPTYEVIPSVARTMNFSLTVRDNNALEAGQTAREDITVTTANVGPFLVTSPNTNVSYVAGSNQNVTWDVAGTNANGINCNFVDIYMSSNSGSTFPILLASAVPNDGNELVTIPNNVGGTNRIMVRAHDNIFYDVSNTNFTITAAPSTFAIGFSGETGKQYQTACPGSTIVYPMTYTALAGFSGSTTLSASGNPPGTTVTFSPNPVTASGPVTMTISNTSGMVDGVYPMAITATSGATIKNVNFYLVSAESFFSPITLTSPSNLASNQGLNTVLQWSVDPLNADGYDVQVATDNAFTNLVHNQTVTSSGFTTSLSSNTTYYWRIRPRFSACAGPFSSTFQFTTGNLGIDDAQSFAFMVSPNPSNGTFSIRGDHFASDKIQAIVYDMRGRVIFDQSYAANGNLDTTIQLRNAQAGVYLLTITDGVNRQVSRIVVK